MEYEQSQMLLTVCLNTKNESFIDELKIFEFFCEDVVAFPQNFNLNVFDNYMSTESKLNIINSSVILKINLYQVYIHIVL